MLPPIEEHEYDPIKDDMGTPIYHVLRNGFVWNVSYGDEEQRVAALPATQQIPLEGIVVPGTDWASRPKASDDQTPSPAKMPATIIRPEARVKGRGRHPR